MFTENRIGEHSVFRWVISTESHAPNDWKAKIKQVYYETLKTIWNYMRFNWIIYKIYYTFNVHNPDIKR